MVVVHTFNLSTWGQKQADLCVPGHPVLKKPPKIIRKFKSSIFNDNNKMNFCLFIKISFIYLVTNFYMWTMYVEHIHP